MGEDAAILTTAAVWKREGGTGDHEARPAFPSVAQTLADYQPRTGQRLLFQSFTSKSKLDSDDPASHKTDMGTEEHGPVRSSMRLRTAEATQPVNDAATHVDATSSLSHSVSSTDE
jgi:hypothetical protein